ncbi:MAG: hypothetical protein ACKOAN_10005 [Chakrabartia sp.]
MNRLNPRTKGGIGAGIGIALGKHIASHKRVMELGFAALVIMIGGYVMLRGVS